jgi:hypothetical protein
MIVNVFLVDMGSYNERVIPLGESFGQFTADTVRFFRRGLAGDKRLAEVVGDTSSSPRVLPVKAAYCRLEKRN